MSILHRKGQNTLEYAVIIAVIVAALISMQAYIKRGLQGRMKQASDDIGDQYSPSATAGTYGTVSSATSTETIAGGAAPTTTTVSSQTQSRNVSENISDFSTEAWP